MGNSIEHIKMPNWLRGFLLIGIGLTGLHLSVGNVDIGNVKLDVMTIILVTVFTCVFTYGIISLIKDYQEGGFDNIINKIKDFF